MGVEVGYYGVCHVPAYAIPHFKSPNLDRLIACPINETTLVSIQVDPTTSLVIKPAHKTEAYKFTSISCWCLLLQTSSSIFCEFDY